jgi:predicted O-linked N-acetylglucosamine transferase (SPINDLY family)
MPELITSSPLDYEKKAIELALNPSKLTNIKSQLSINRNTAPLFDIENSVRSIELSYTKIYSRYKEGLDPISFHVGSQSSHIRNISGKNS